MIRVMPLAMALACAACSTFAMDAMQNMQQQQMQQMLNGSMQYRESPLLKMRVYLKGENKPLELDSFRLAADKYPVWRYKDENGIIFKGGKIQYRTDEIDSIVLENGMQGAPHGENLIYLGRPGAISFYNLYPDTSDIMPDFIRKGRGDILRADTKSIRLVVEDDPEALGLINRYSDRWLWRGGLVGVGAALVGAGLGIAVATEEKDENGKRKPTTPVAGIMVIAGLATVVVPLTSILNFIWDPLPKRSLDTYNRNRVGSK